VKIIANTNSGFMLECTRDELALLAGLSGAYSDDFRKMNKEIGSEFDISEITNVSRFVRNLNQNHLKGIKNSLRCAIKKIDDAEETVKSLSLFETLKEVE